MAKYIKLLGLIILCQSVGVLGSFFTFKSIPTWYIGLVKPFFNPPNWLFGPVWGILYTLMGISIFRIVEVGKKDTTWAKKLFWSQLFFNGIWTPVFFGAKNLGGAFLIIIILLVLIVRTIKEFRRIDATSAYLLYPYLVWASFAAILNLSIWILNG